MKVGEFVYCWRVLTLAISNIDDCGKDLGLYWRCFLLYNSRFSMLTLLLLSSRYQHGKFDNERLKSGWRVLF